MNKFLMRGEFNIKKELRILSIANELKISRQEAENIFRAEIKEKYATNDIQLAESMYKSDIRKDKKWR